MKSHHLLNWKISTTFTSDTRMRWSSLIWLICETNLVELSRNEVSKFQALCTSSISSTHILVLKGMVSNSINIFLLYEQEIINKKLTSKISVDSSIMFTSYAWLCALALLHRLLWLLISHVLSTWIINNHSHFIWKWFQPHSFEELCYIKEIYKYLKWFHLLEVLRVPSIWN